MIYNFLFPYVKLNVTWLPNVKKVPNAYLGANANAFAAYIVTAIHCDLEIEKVRK